MRPLADLARLAGFQVLVSVSTSCIEIMGEGRWHVFERECMNLVRHSEHDHITVILRDALGHRELCDVGKKGERRAQLPMAGTHYGSLPECRIRGVRKVDNRYIGQITANGHHIYLGTFMDMMSAGLARDEYVLSHGLHTPLNFPHMAEVRKEEMEMAVTE